MLTIKTDQVSWDEEKGRKNEVGGGKGENAWAEDGGAVRESLEIVEWPDDLSASIRRDGLRRRWATTKPPSYDPLGHSVSHKFHTPCCFNFPMALVLK